MSSRYHNAVDDITEIIVCYSPTRSTAWID